MYKFKLFVFILLIVFVLFLIYKKLDTCSDVTQGYKVGLTEITYNDLNRNREIKTAIWYPANNNAKTECASHSIWKRDTLAKNADILDPKLKYPLIMFSHGYGLDKWSNSWFAHFMASQGYIVVTMDHYGNTYDNMIPKYSLRPFERARDISFVLDKLLSLDTSATQTLPADAESYGGHGGMNGFNLAKLIDQNRIGMAGYSQGGAACLWIAGAQASYVNLVDDYNKTNVVEKKALHELFKDQKAYEAALCDFDYNLANSTFKDARIKAVFAMAPGIDEQFVYFNNFAHINIPVFIVAGDADEIIDSDKNAKFYALQIKNAQIKIIPGATHWTFLNEETFLGHLVEPKLIYDKAIALRVKDHEIVGDMALDFFEKNL